MIAMTHQPVHISKELLNKISAEQAWYYRIIPSGINEDTGLLVLYYDE